MNVIVKKQTDIAKRMQEAGMVKETIAKEISFAKQIVDGNAYLQKCEPASLLAAVVNVANVGLTLNPAARESYIVPRYDSQSRTTQAHLMPSYIGLIKLIIQEGSVKSIQAQCVYRNDKFTFQPTDSDRPIIHSADPFGDRGELIGVYAVATLADGTKQAEAMSMTEIKEIRESSESWKREKSRQYSPWSKHFEEMARKTVVRRIFKYLPRGEKNDHLFRAIELDNQDNGATFDQINYIESLLPGANITPERSEEIHRDFQEYTFEEAKAVISELKEAQVNDVRYTGTGMIQKGEGSLKANLKNAAEDERR